MNTKLFLIVLHALLVSPLLAQESFAPRGLQMYQLLTDSQATPKKELGDLRQMLLSGIYMRSPLGRFEQKQFSPGVKDFRSDARCRVEDLSTLFMLQQPPMRLTIPDLNDVVVDQVPHERTKDLQLSIRYFESQLVFELGKQLGFFARQNNSSTRDREICITSANFGSPNAFSIGFGFMAFDPQLFFQIARAEKANSWSMRMILAHELAHQFQNWHQSPTMTKVKRDPKTGVDVFYVRDQELEADCVASVILAQQREVQGVVKPEEDLPENFQAALYDAVISIGDFEFGLLASHHGTAYERALMTKAGLRIYEELKGRKDLRSESVLKACQDTIFDLNRLYGDELWPIGSPLPDQRK